MIKRPSRLFLKFFLLITSIQITSDLVVHAWIDRRHMLEEGAYLAPPPSMKEPPPPGGQPHRHGPPPVETAFELAIDLGASLSCAMLLAWLFSKPIRSLNFALRDAASGNLDIRVADRMGPGMDEMKELGIEFDRMIARLNTIITAQRRLLNDVSHEIRSPMARIQAAIGLAHQQPDQALPLLERIERESVRIDRLIGELLALSRLQAGVDNKPYEEIDLRELVSDIVDDARFEASAKGRFIQMGSEIDGAVRGNVELLRRAVENVVRNAIKYSHRGGTVTIDTRPGAAGGTAVISVQDAGSGVPESDLANIFDPFFRSPTHQRKEGSGLGLEIAKRVVETHGGVIRASNVPTGGLRVDIELPLLT
jgi:signal transduction histidine kinase